ncbi:hypothetical protein D5086_009959 [Populus alba]|uniref:Uncharacterized protein n=1 Tax=Populus alba TaxID=43335 RepID=A0ACC4C8V5_POPAL
MKGSSVDRAPTDSCSIVVSRQNMNEENLHAQGVDGQMFLDACLQQDPESKVACEICTKTNMAMVFGEITTKAKVDY